MFERQRNQVRKLLIIIIIMGFWSFPYEINHPFQFALGSQTH